MSGDSFLQWSWERIGVGLVGRLHSEVDQWREQCFDLRAGDLRDTAFEDERDARAGRYFARVWCDRVIVDLDMAQEAVFCVGAAVEVEDDAVPLEYQRGDDDTIARGGRLSFLVDQLFVLCRARGELTVRLKRNSCAYREGAVGEALLCFEIANELAAAAFGEFCLWKLNAGGGEVGGDAVGGGFFADDEDLGTHGRERQGQEACGDGRSVCECHGSTSDIEQLALSLCF